MKHNALLLLTALWIGFQAHGMKLNYAFSEHVLGLNLEVIVTPNVVGATNPALQFLVSDVDDTIPSGSQIHLNFGDGITINGGEFFFFFANRTSAQIRSVVDQYIVISGFNALDFSPILFQMQGKTGSYFSFLHNNTVVSMGIYYQSNLLAYMSCNPLIVPAVLGNKNIDHNLAILF